MDAAASRRDWVGNLAERAGRAVRWLRDHAVVRSVPAAAGALALSYGAGQIYRPLFWVAAGVFLLLVDHRTSV